MLVHTIPPVYDGSSKILILGSFPSVASREAAFFYGHPQNRFWRVMAAVYDEELPKTVDEKRALLIKNGVALWDCIYCCDIVNSSDASIKKAVPNDIGALLEKTRIRRIFVNGKTAERVYNKFILPKTGISAVCLPSTSPANAAFTLEKLVFCWKTALK